MLWLHVLYLVTSWTPHPTHPQGRKKKKNPSLNRAKKQKGATAHLSGLKADGLEGSESQVVPVGELCEPTDDAGKQTGNRLNSQTTIRSANVYFNAQTCLWERN